MIRSLPRLTVRKLLMTVAIASIVIEVEVWRRRYPLCQHLAARSAEVECFHREMASSHERIASLYRGRAARTIEGVRYHHKQAAIFASAARSELANAQRAADQIRSYRRAALLPWVGIAPGDHGSKGMSRTPGEERP